MSQADQSLKAAIVEVAIAARDLATARRVGQCQTMGHGAHEAVKELMEVAEDYADSLRTEHGMTYQRGVEILRTALQDIRRAA